MMESVFELLNKIRWDKKENPQDYSIWYYDRVEDKEIPIKFGDIKEINKFSLVVEKNLEEIEIPLHRIRAVKRKGICIWKREP